MAGTRKHRRELNYEVAKLRVLQQFVEPIQNDPRAKALAIEIRDQAEICLDLLDQYQSSLPGRMWSYAERTCQPLRQDLKRTAMHFRAASGEWELRTGEHLWGQSWWNSRDLGAQVDEITDGHVGTDTLPILTGVERQNGSLPSALSDPPQGRVVGRARPSQDDYQSAARLGLLGLIPGQDLDRIVEELAAFHRPGDIFPAEVLLELAAAAIEESGVSLSDPMQYEELRDRHLHEYDFESRSRQRKNRYTLMAAALMRAGVYPDLLAEAYGWGIEDMWQYALYALIAYARAAAERTDQTLEAVAVVLAARRGVDLEVASDS